MFLFLCIFVNFLLARFFFILIILIVVRWCYIVVVNCIYLINHNVEHISTGSFMGSLYILLGYMSIHMLCLLFSWAVCTFTVELYWLFMGTCECSWGMPIAKELSRWNATEELIMTSGHWIPRRCPRSQWLFFLAFLLS